MEGKIREDKKNHLFGLIGIDGVNGMEGLFFH
jgi:hypothetical protein